MNNNPILQFLIIRALHRMTAKAMGVPYRPGKPALQSYARFTQEQLEQLATRPDAREKMYQAARDTGSLIRKVLLIRTDDRARRVLFRLYAYIGITLSGVCPGEITVEQCYFSRFYTPEMCRIMSSMDAGIFAGIFGGGKLHFHARITEGCPCCRAEFTPGEE